MSVTTQVVVHFKPGTSAATCSRHIAEKALPLVKLTKHMFPTSNDEALRSIYLFMVPSTNVDKLCSIMREVEDVRAVHVGAERSLA